MAEKPFALRAADQTHLVAITTCGRSAACTMKRADALLQLQAGHNPAVRRPSAPGEPAKRGALAISKRACKS